MEANSTTFKNPLSLAVGPVKFREESPKRKTPFMVDDLVRNANILMSAPCSDRSLNLPNSSFEGRVQKTIDGGALSKSGINRVNYNHSTFNVLASRIVN